MRLHKVLPAALCACIGMFCESTLYAGRFGVFQVRAVCQPQTWQPSPRPCPQPFLRPGLDLVASGIPGGPAVMPLPCTRTKHRIFGPGLSLSFCHSVILSWSPVFPKLSKIHTEMPHDRPRKSDGLLVMAECPENPAKSHLNRDHRL